MHEYSNDSSCSSCSSSGGGGGKKDVESSVGGGRPGGDWTGGRGLLRNAYASDLKSTAGQFIIGKQWLERLHGVRDRRSVRLSRASVSRYSSVSPGRPTDRPPCLDVQSLRGGRTRIDGHMDRQTDSCLTLSTDDDESCWRHSCTCTE